MNPFYDIDFNPLAPWPGNLNLNCNLITKHGGITTDCAGDWTFTKSSAGDVVHQILEDNVYKFQSTNANTGTIAFTAGNIAGYRNQIEFIGPSLNNRHQIKIPDTHTLRITDVSATSTLTFDLRSTITNPTMELLTESFFVRIPDTKYFSIRTPTANDGSLNFFPGAAAARNILSLLGSSCLAHRIEYDQNVNELEVASTSLLTGVLQLSGGAPIAAIPTRVSASFGDLRVQCATNQYVDIGPKMKCSDTITFDATPFEVVQVNPTVNSISGSQPSVFAYRVNPTENQASGGSSIFSQAGAMNLLNTFNNASSSSNWVGSAFGMNMVSRYQGSASRSCGNVTGVAAQAYVHTAGNATNVTAAQFQALGGVSGSTSVVSCVSGRFLGPSNFIGGATPTTSSAGVFTTPAVGTNKWVIEAQGSTGLSYIAGKLMVGAATAPGWNLDIFAAGRIRDSGGFATLYFGGSSLTDLWSSVGSTAEGNIVLSSHKLLGNAENLVFDMETVANEVSISSTTGVTTLYVNIANLNTLGAASLGLGLTTGGARLKNKVRFTSTPINEPGTYEEVFLNTDSNAITFNLAAGVDKRTLRIVNTGSSGNDVTVSPNGSEHLLGANSSFTLADGEALIITYDNTDGWY